MEIVKELAVPLITGLIIISSGSGNSANGEDIFGSMINIMLPIYLPAAIQGFARRHLITFVHEKQERYKETQKIMGLSSEAYICGWLLTCYVKGILTIIFTMVPIYYSKFGEQQPLGTTFIYFSVYVFAAIHQTFAISTLFNSPKLAGEMGTFILSITSILFYYLTFSESVSQFVYYIVLFFPQPALSFAISINISDNPILNSYSQTTAQIMLVFNMIFYLVLYFYLDEVVPNEYGISQHPLFFIRKEFWVRSLHLGSNRSRSNQGIQGNSGLDYQNLVEDDINSENFGRSQRPTQAHSTTVGLSSQQNREQVVSQEMMISQNFKSQEVFSINQGDEESQTANQSAQLALSPPDQSSAKFHEHIRQIDLKATSVRIDNLAKTFGKVRAVDGVSLSLYENQIFCLLGHNGAGKTTIISLLTGMIKKTDGSIKIHDKELESNLGDSRRLMGLCTQKDVLYDEFTAVEHLEFIANIKGLYGSAMNQEVNSVIQEVGLTLEKDKIAKTLSGGNKRKLSLAMALVGKSKIIFLDEPTSGMDAVSRQAIWKILENIRTTQNRTIVLTTHHMDEAERLANRIAIMSQGKLLILGSADYIKKEFGIGYNLTITCKNSEQLQEFLEQKQSIIDSVKALVPGATVDEQTLKDTIKFLWPFQAQNTFASTLQQLELNPIIQVNLEMNSLEDSFVKIGMDDEMRAENGRQSYADLIAMPKPASLTRQDSRPIFSFTVQLHAMILRQFYLTTRNWQAILMIILPVIFNFLGAYISKHFLDNLKDYIDDIIRQNTGPSDSIPDMTPFIFYFQTSIFCVFIVQAYSMNSSIYVLTPVLEREKSLKYALNVMGCRPLPYWLGTLISDYTAYFSTFVLFFYALLSSDVQFLNGYYTQLFILMAIFGSALITFSYVCGFLFSSSNSAFKAFPLVAFFVSYEVPVILNSLLLTFLPSVQKLGLTIMIFLSPFTSLSYGLQTMNSGSSMSPKADKLNELIPFTSWSSYALILALQSTLFLFAAIFIEKIKYSIKNDNAQPNPQVYYNPINADEGVRREIDRVKDSNNNDPIKVKDLQKIYKNGFHAVKGTTFGVENGQVFGLLGPNGAGKSTTFNTLTANIPKSSGTAALHGVDVAENPVSYFENIGVCPQINCLWEYLNPVEHLRVFGRIKGLSGKELEETVNYYISQIQLKNFTCKATNLSGGNQRKLCVANSLIGSPSLLFFDEPSTGLDPIAKRYLWRCLRENLLAKNSAIVLTTHSLQEAEDLCNKIGIQVNGQFMCLDTLQNLKNTKGDGYKFTIKLPSNREYDQEIVGVIESQILSEFPTAQLLKINSNTNNQGQQQQPSGSPQQQGNDESVEIDYNRLIFKVPFDANFSFAKAFALLYNKLKREQEIIEDFSIAQASLEEIFIQFSSYQITNTLNNNASPNSRP